MRETKAKGPKILLLDIETAPMSGYIWSLWDNNVALNQMVSDWYILSWSAKWLGDPPSKIMYEDQSRAKDIEDDSVILKKLWHLLDSADIIITQNGQSFDQRKIFARFIMQNIEGGQPPSSFKHIDTMLVAKRAFAFSSHKLEYMTDKLNKKYKKLKHTKFSGFELWRECLARNPEAWREMKKYNMYDVLALEELYNKIIPWSDKAPNFSLYDDNAIHTCRCGSQDFKLQGFAYTSKGKYQRYRCKKCGTESRDTVNLFSEKKRASLHMNVTR